MFQPSRRRAVRACMLALLAMAGGAASAQPGAATGNPIKIALIESLSGSFANTGEAVFRNILWATERVNARGGVKLPGGARPLAVVRYDSKGTNEGRCRRCARPLTTARISSCRATPRPQPRR